MFGLWPPSPYLCVLVLMILTCNSSAQASENHKDDSGQALEPGKESEPGLGVLQAIPLADASFWNDLVSWYSQIKI